MTRAQADEILRELRNIEGMMERNTPTAAPNIVAAGLLRVPLPAGTPSLGQANAPVAIMEFTDLQCPHCREFQADTFPVIRARLISSGKVRFISRDLPLPTHTFAFKAAEATRCAGAQGQFWPFRDAVLALADPPTPARLDQVAARLKLDKMSFSACVGSRTFDEDIRADAADAKAAGIRGTPSFVIGRVGDGEVTGQVVTGAQPFSIFQAAVMAALKPAKPLTNGSHGR